MSLGHTGGGLLREPSNNNVFNPFEPNSYSSENWAKPSQKPGFNRAPGAPVHSNSKKSPHVLQPRSQPLYSQSNTQDVRLPQNYLPSTPMSTNTLMNFNQGQATGLNSSLDFHQQREFFQLNLQEELHRQKRLQQEQIQLQMLQALRMQSMIKNAQAGMSLLDNNLMNKVNPIMNQAPVQKPRYPAIPQSIQSPARAPAQSPMLAHNLNSLNQRRQNRSVEQSNLTKKLKDCQEQFNNLKVDLDLRKHCERDNLKTEELCLDLQRFVLPHVIQNYPKLMEPPFKKSLYLLYAAIQNCREARDQEILRQNDHTTKYVSDALGILTKEILAVRSQLFLIRQNGVQSF